MENKEWKMPIFEVVEGEDVESNRFRLVAEILLTINTNLVRLGKLLEEQNK